MPTEGRLLGSVQLLGRAWHVSAAVTEGIGSPVLAVLTWGEICPIFSAKCFTHGGSSLPFEFQRQVGAHHSSTSGNYHILAFLAERV